MAYSFIELNKAVGHVMRLVTLLWLWFSVCLPSDGQVMVESSDKTWFTGEGNGKPLQYFCLENPMNSMKRQKDRTLKDELPRSIGAQYATGDHWRNNSRKNEGMVTVIQVYAPTINAQEAEIEWFY